MPYATRNGVRLFYNDAGSGDPPLLFIHGWCCDHSYWRDQIPEFAQRHRVVAVDLRGTGDSDAPDEDSKIAQFVDDVAWLSKEVGLDRPVLVGHSMGGLIALNIVRKWPELARAAVFVDAATVPFPEQFQPLLASTLESLRSPGYRAVAMNVFKSFLFGPESPEAMKEDVAARMANAPQRLMHTALADTISEANMAGGPLPLPSLFVRAATNPATEEEFKERYPGMQVVTVDCAHFIQMEKPAEFNAIFKRFLEKLP